MKKLSLADAIVYSSLMISFSFLMSESIKRTNNLMILNKRYNYYNQTFIVINSLEILLSAITLGSLYITIMDSLLL